MFVCRTLGALFIYPRLKGMLSASGPTIHSLDRTERPARIAIRRQIAETEVRNWRFPEVAVARAMSPSGGGADVANAPPCAPGSRPEGPRQFSPNSGRLAAPSRSPIPRVSRIHGHSLRRQHLASEGFRGVPRLLVSPAAGLPRATSLRVGAWCPKRQTWRFVSPPVR